MTKNYYYKGIKYYYCRHYRRWIVELEDGFYYEATKKDAEEIIDLFIKDKEDK